MLVARQPATMGSMQPQQPQQQQQQQQQAVFGYDLNQGHNDSSLLDQHSFLDAFDLTSSADPNSLDQASNEETLLTQGNRNTLADFFNFAANSDSSFDFAGSRSYGEGVGALAQSWGWISPDTVVGHGIILPGDNHVNSMLQASYPGLAQSSFSGTTQYSVQPQHIFNEMATHVPEAAGSSIGSRSAMTQAGPQGDMSFNTNTIQNMPILSGRPQQHSGHAESVDSSRHFHDHNMYGLPAAPSFSRQSRPSRQPPPISFGTDPNFNSGGFYVPSSTRDTSDAIAAGTLATLGCLERNPSAAPTRAPSPALPTPSAHIPETIVEHANDELHQRPVKRRKSSRPDDEQKPKAYQPDVTSIIATEETTPTPTTIPSPGGTPTSAATKNTTSTTVTSPQGAATPPTAGKRKRPSTAPPKTSRENLTEEQKRNNHIKSEQKRRNVIKTGFDVLNKVVPACKGGGYSKAVILNHTYDFVVKLHQGNQELRNLLEKIGANGHGNGTLSGSDRSAAESVGSSSG
ncbi:hypothetical protein QBC44DRAFT_79089 [Cladorrhinum sp. PSN332]|nr:hypothetical protein QBC44DRAFT_79089 [Cladorrhinum sp. PSN332]